VMSILNLADSASWVVSHLFPQNKPTQQAVRIFVML
jgi:hypothetical protein